MVLFTIDRKFRLGGLACLAIWAFGMAAWTARAEVPKPSPTPAPARPADIFSFLEKPAAPQGPGKMDCAFEYKPSGSAWNPGLDEGKVFLAALEAGDMRLGIGKGGQIYSLRGAFGESVPPQRAAAPWIDEVWHVVATSEPLVAPVHEFQNGGVAARWASAMPIQFFIHQAGIYLKGLTGTAETGFPTEPFYSPLLRRRWDPASRTLFLANWAQQARTPNAWKSGLIVQTAYRDLGGGAIEVAQLLSNFGDQQLTYLNAPWGGVRRSSLPHTVLSEPGGGWKKVAGVWGWSGIPSKPFDETGGWIGWTVDSKEDSSPALAMVFGREGGGTPPWRRSRSKILYGTAGETDNRDYEAVETACSIDLNPGESLLVRWYLVAGPFGKVRARAAELAPHATIEKPAFDASLRQPVWVKDGVPSSSGEGEPAFHLHAQPLPGTLPVFTMRNPADGKVFATLDLYKLTRTSPFPNPLPETNPEYPRYQNRVVHHTHEPGAAPVELLGFAFPSPPQAGEAREIPLRCSNGSEIKVWGPR
jgi:hypothetical protein